MALPKIFRLGFLSSGKDKKDSPSELSKFVANFIPMVKERSVEFVRECKEAREKLKDIPGTNYSLGLKHLKQGNLDDAIMRFRMVSFLKPDNYMAHYQLGRCMIMAGDNDNAKKQFEKTLEINKSDQSTKYQLKKLEKPEQIRSVPVEIIKELAEDFVPIFEAVYLNNGYQGGKEAVKAALDNIKDKNPNLNVLDLGCGSGGCGYLLQEKDVVKNITAVEIAPTFAKFSKELKFNKRLVYSKVVEQDIAEYLLSNKEKFDLIIADMSLYFYGDLTDVFDSVKRSLNKDGLFVLSLQAFEEEKRYKLDIEYDIFSHSKSYIQEQLNKAGFNKLEIRDIELIEGEPAIIFVYKA